MIPGVEEFNRRLMFLPGQFRTNVASFVHKNKLICADN